jgi:hypothetical protein
VTKELSKLPGVDKVDETEEAIVAEEKYEFSEDGGEFLADSSIDPEETAMKFLTETKRSLLVCI